MSMNSDVDSMGTVTIDNPVEYRKKNVDSQGKIYVGKDYAEKEARVVIELVEDTSE